MNKRIRELALQAGAQGIVNRDFIDIEKFAELVRSEEREACAKVCEEDESGRDSGGYYAEIIRARGEA